MEPPAQEIERIWTAPSSIRASVYAALAVVALGVLLPDFRYDMLSVVLLLAWVIGYGGEFIQRRRRTQS